MERFWDGSSIFHPRIIPIGILGSGELVAAPVWLSLTRSTNIGSGTRCDLRMSTFGALLSSVGLPDSTGSITSTIPLKRVFLSFLTLVA